MAHGSSPDSSLPRRAIAVVMLCAIATIGLLARQALPASGHTWAARASERGLYDLVGVADGAAVVGSMIFLVFVIRLRRAHRKADAGDEADLPWWTRAASMGLPVLVVSIPVALLIRAVLNHRAHETPNRAPVGAHFLGGHGHGSSSGSWSMVAGMVLAVVALIVLAVIEYRRRRGRPPLTGMSLTDAEDGGLSAALSAGAAVLATETDPRAAIIACYAAMERSLAAAGAVPTAADTPDEVLTRAVEGGLVHVTAASELTSLFRQARYGGRVMAESERAAARGALERLTADLQSSTRLESSTAAGSDIPGAAGE